MTAALRRASAAPPWAHALAYGVLLVVLVPIARPTEGVFTPDEGSYGLQVQALRDGRWEYDYGGEAFDPDGDWFPLAGATRGDGGWYAYVQHPAYPLALRGSTAVLGREAGVHAVPMLGALATAAVAWSLAAQLGRSDAARAAFWLAGLSPVLVNGTVLWAHTVSAAAGGLALVGAVRLRRRLDAVGLAAAVAGAAGGVLLRSEGLLVAGAIAIGVLVASGSRWRRGVAPAAAVAVSAAVAFLGELAWTRSIAGGSVGARGIREEADAAGSLLRGRLDGLWHTLADGAYDDPASGAILVPVLVLVPFAALAVRRRGVAWRRDALVALAAVAALYAVRFAVDPVQSITGLLVAWPVALAALVLLPRHAVDGAMRVVLVTVAAHVAAVLATQYDIGGGLEWGGRFLSPVLAPLAVVAAVGLVESTRSLERRADRRGLVAAAAAIAVGPALAGVAVVGGYRADSARLVEQIASAVEGRSLVVTHEIVLPRFAWREHPRLQWMLEPDPDRLPRVVGAAAGARVHRLALVVPSSFDRLAPYGVAAEATGPRVADFGWQTLVVRRR